MEISMVVMDRGDCYTTKCEEGTSLEDYRARMEAHARCKQHYHLLRLIVDGEVVHTY